MFLVRRNLALSQPGVADGTGVNSKTINEDNPPDENYLFGQKVGCRLLYIFWDKIAEFFQNSGYIFLVKGFNFRF